MRVKMEKKGALVAEDSLRADLPASNVIGADQRAGALDRTAALVPWLVAVIEARGQVPLVRPVFQLDRRE